MILRQKKWLESSKNNPEEVNRLCRDWGTNPYVAEILLRRGYKTYEEIKSFLTPELSDLRDPYELRNMSEAVDLLRSMIIENRRIVILGDYDVDGITATALVLEFLKKCGKLNLDFFIPNRMIHGYGLTRSSAEIIIDMKPELVITVDNGITAAHEVDRLNQEGIKTIITDHHLADSNLLPAGIVINPNHPKCNYPFKKISGCGVALKLIMALRKSLREIGWWTQERPEPNLRESLDLAALGTVADVMPLIDENRILTYHGLLVMKEKPRLAIRILQKLKKIKTVTSRTLGFQFAPLLNAAGRMEDADVAVRFLLSKGHQEAEIIAKKLDSVNYQRRDKEGLMLKEALSLIEKEEQGPAIILVSSNFHEGINGIVATRLVERFYKPVLILSKYGAKLKGSGRSIPELHLKEALSDSSDLLDRFGGHSAAAGCSLKIENLQAFRERFFTFCKKNIPESTEQNLQIDGKIEFSKLTNLFVEQLDRLQPFGEGNLEPIFSLSTPELPFKKIKNKHLKCEINEDIEIIGWNQAESFSKISPTKLAVNLCLNEFRGRRKIQLTIQDTFV